MGGGDAEAQEFLDTAEGAKKAVEIVASSSAARRDAAVGGRMLRMLTGAGDVADLQADHFYLLPASLLDLLPSPLWADGKRAIGFTSPEAVVTCYVTSAAAKPMRLNGDGSLL